MTTITKEFQDKNINNYKNKETKTNKTQKHNLENENAMAKDEERQLTTKVLPRDDHQLHTLRHQKSQHKQ
eukprot:2124627-Amphidinium_carterae.2